MLTWRDDWFQALREVGGMASHVPDWRLYAAYCSLLERGLRRPALRELDAFVAKLAGAEFASRLDFTRWVLTRHEERRRPEVLLPYPLRVCVITPTLEEWTRREPSASEPHRLIGGLDHLRRAVALDPSDPQSRVSLAKEIVRHLEYSCHEMPFGYLGDPIADLEMLAEAERVAEGLAADGGATWLEYSFRDIRQRVESYLATKPLVPGQPTLEGPRMNPWTTLDRRAVYDNPWIAVREDQVIRPDGKPGIYGVVHFKNRAVGVLPVDVDGSIWLVGQHRYPLDRYSWEIPEGGSPEGEKDVETAMRELREETGLVASTVELLGGEIHLSNSVSDEAGVVFRASGLTRGESEPEGTERLEVRRVPFVEAMGMLDRGEITDSLTAIALLREALRRA